jgi:hypothetical protein
VVNMSPVVEASFTYQSVASTVLQINPVSAKAMIFLIPGHSGFLLSKLVYIKCAFNCESGYSKDWKSLYKFTSFTANQKFYLCENTRLKGFLHKIGY